MKCLIFGKGFFGNRFHNFLENSVLSDARINCAKDAEDEINRVEPDVVINCIGITGKPNIDWCEDHKAETLFGNVTVPLLLLEACQRTGVKLVHMSSGCIYAGDNNGRGFSEDDEPNFFGSFYSRTKIYAEKALKEFDVLQVRVRIPLDIYSSPKNLIDKLTAYKKILDTDNSITYVPDFLVIVKQLMEKNATGVFNVVNKGPLRYPYLIGLYKEMVDKDFEYETITPEQLDVMVKAPRANCVLSVEKLEKIGIDVRPVNDAVKECLEKYKKGNEKR